MPTTTVVRRTESAREVLRRQFVSRTVGQNWQEIISDLYIPLEFEALRSGPFHAQIQHHRIGRLDLSHYTTDPERVDRRQQHIDPHAQPYFMLQIQMSGTTAYEHLGQEYSLTPGSFTLIDTTEPYSFMHTDVQSALCLKVPALALRGRVIDPVAFCGRQIEVKDSYSRGGLKLLTGATAESYGLTLADAPHIEAYLLDTIALILNMSADRTPINGTSARRAIHRRATSFMQSNLHRPELSPEMIADGTGISLRYLHRVFEDSGVSVRNALMNFRVEHAMASLQDPQLFPLSMKEIAFRCGFKSQSHFASAFGARFGITPRQARSAVR
ncbi:helix-turn-helix domain-containing protein [Novosphingobium mathurense]|uniref:Transcriptional regulator, AraC family n=1 Tax=Novosphingobium mathurense TaxID=428990 RepID=A0A1U6IIR9_9SPHN|nr:helix-turn-helix domain-containing protein [Novosphingobium mathurense]SLK07918.1 transcriptional regulator, AraC family [Novosphingobium mathurense]